MSHKLLYTYEFQCDVCKKKVIVHQDSERLPKGWKYSFIDEPLCGQLYAVNRQEICEDLHPSE
jgi:hypothetical protein